MTEVRLPQGIVDRMVAHCEAGRPNEACGVLAAKDGRLVKVFPLTNAAASPVRYSLDPKEQLAVYRTLDDEGCELGAIYHSHTRTEAYPSPTDVRLAVEPVPYIIVSLAGASPVLRAFRIVKEDWTYHEGEIEEVAVVVEG